MPDDYLQSHDFDVALPPNARIGALSFDEARKTLRVVLTDGGAERGAPVDSIRAFYGARIRHEILTHRPKQKRSKELLRFGASPPSTGAGGRFSRETAVAAEELHYALALRVDGVGELWYLLAASFNFRKTLGDESTYSTDINFRTLVRRLCNFAPQAVQDSFFTAVLKGLPLPPPVESLREFFKIASR